MSESVEESESRTASSRVGSVDDRQGPLGRLGLERLERRCGARVGRAIFTFVNGTISVALLAGVARLAEAPFVFPSLGPTAFLFFYRPRAEAASPRNTIAGHFIGAAAGWVSLVMFGLVGAPSAIVAGVSWGRAAAAGLSLGVTGGLMALLDAI